MSEFDDQLADLRHRFVCRAAEDRELIAAAAEQQRVDEIRTISHRLVGLAGLFGFDEVGMAAEAVETALDSGAFTAETRALCAKLVEELSSLDMSSSNPPPQVGEGEA